MRRLTVATLLLVASCTSAPAPAPVSGPALTRWDGRYYGEAVMEGNSLECASGSTPVRITVARGQAWIGPRHRHHRLAGTVDASGQIALMNDTGSRTLRGSISGNQLTAVESLPHVRSVSLEAPGATSTCMAVVNATRSSGGTGDSQPD